MMFTISNYFKTVFIISKNSCGSRTWIVDSAKSFLLRGMIVSQFSDNAE